MSSRTQLGEDAVRFAQPLKAAGRIAKDARQSGAFDVERRLEGASCGRSHKRRCTRETCLDLSAHRRAARCQQHANAREVTADLGQRLLPAQRDRDRFPGQIASTRQTP